MRYPFQRIAALSTLALLAACASGPQGAEVTRFHLGAPIARSTVALVPADPQAANSLEYRSYADAVARELTAQSFIVTDNQAGAAYAGQLGVEQTARPGSRRGGFSIGIGGGSFGNGGGVGGGVSVPIASARPTDIRTTTLRLQLKRRSDNSVIWEGRASSEAQGPAGDASRAVPALAKALLDGFPGPANQTVRVRAR